MATSGTRLDARHYNHNELRRLRETQGKSMAQVAEELGSDRWRVWRAETGTVVSYEFLCRLAQYYRKPVTEFLYPYPAVD